MPYVHPFIQVTTGIANVRVHPKCEGIAKWTTDQVSMYSFTRNMPDSFCQYYISILYFCTNKFMPRHIVLGVEWTTIIPSNADSRYQSYCYLLLLLSAHTFRRLATPLRSNPPPHYHKPPASISPSHSDVHTSSASSSPCSLHFPRWWKFRYHQ